jgi:hypothetical protein
MASTAAQVEADAVAMPTDIGLGNRRKIEASGGNGDDRRRPCGRQLLNFRLFRAV